MFICICSPLTEEQITEAIEHGARRPDDIFAYWQSSVNCGQCTHEMQLMVNAFDSTGKTIVLPMAPPDPPTDND